MTLNNLKDLLLSIGPPVFHYFASGQTGNYIVWAEDNQADAVHSDGKMRVQVIEGTIDYFTKKEFDETVIDIQKTLNDAGISWRLSSVQREEDTGYIHYEWVFQIGGTQWLG